MTALRADLYHALAEALAEPPEWLAWPGREWPLFEIATRLAADNGCLHPAPLRFGGASQGARCLEKLAEIRAEPLAGRRKRYARLFVGSGHPQFWLYESAFLTGRILGPETFAVERLYRAAGLETVGAELPDHASLELAFLAHLAEAGQDTISPHEQQFIKMHAGRWLPHLGQTLALAGDEVYGPIGQLLADWLAEIAACRAASVGGRAALHPARTTRLPLIPQEAACTLCGFCVPACPTRALIIHETQTETSLVLNAAACVGCSKCERVCEMQALKMAQAPEGRPPPSAGHWAVLRKSPRVPCQVCGAPLVSRAELDFVAAQIGCPVWLEYCPECRQQFTSAEIAR